MMIAFVHTCMEAQTPTTILTNAENAKCACIIIIQHQKGNVLSKMLSLEEVGETFVDVCTRFVLRMTACMYVQKQSSSL